MRGSIAELKEGAIPNQFEERIYRDFPAGWQCPAEMAKGFLVAAALELKARRRINSVEPFAEGAFAYLPSKYRYDSFGALVMSNEGIGRLPLLFLARTFTDEILDTYWHLRGTDPAGSVGTVISQLSGISLGQHGTSLFMAAFQHAWFLGWHGSLSHVEQDFADGEAIAGVGRGTLHPQGAMYMESIWDISFRLIERSSPEHYLDLYADRLQTVNHVLDGGGELGAGDVVSKYRLWPGWPNPND